MLCSSLLFSKNMPSEETEAWEGTFYQEKSHAYLSCPLPCPIASPSYMYSSLYSKKHHEHGMQAWHDMGSGHGMLKNLGFGAGGRAPPSRLASSPLSALFPACLSPSYNLFLYLPISLSILRREHYMAWRGAVRPARQRARGNKNSKTWHGGAWARWARLRARQLAGRLGWQAGQAG